MSEGKLKCPSCLAEVDNPKFQFCPFCQKPLGLLGQVYRLEQPLEAGAHGVVYLAHRADRAASEKFAVKVLKKEALSVDRMLGKRFKKEVRLLQELAGHPNIVNILEADEDEVWGAYYAMEFVPGASLQVMLDRHMLPTSQLHQVARQLFDAISHAHRLGAVHRDLKPGNILVYEDQEGYHVKVIDFGIAKILDTTTEKLTQTHTAMGTPQYMAPEQWANDNVGTHSDIYSLGIIAYQMLTGATPFEDADTIMALTHAHLRLPPPAFGEHQPDVAFPAGLEQAVLKALQKAPEDRHPDVDAFWSALDAPLEAFASETHPNLVSAFAPTEEKPVSALIGSPVDEDRHTKEDRHVDDAFLPTMISQGVPSVQTPADSPGKGILTWIGLGLVMAALLVGSLYFWGTGQVATRANPPKKAPTTPAKSPVAGQKGHRPIPESLVAKAPRKLILKAGASRQVPWLSGARQVYIPAGRFIMGSPSTEPGRDADELLHEVRLSRSFWILHTEITQGQFQKLMSRNPSEFKRCGPQCPVERVTFFDAMAFANQLSRKHGLPTCFVCQGSGRKLACSLRGKYRSQGAYYRCKGWRLPTEAEWEYAARAGAREAYTTGKCLSRQQACFDGSKPVRGCPKSPKASGTQKVALHAANRWGLFDVQGNVWEWTWDLYTIDRSGARSRVLDPVAPGSHLRELLQQKVKRVLRGGSWYDPARICRLANRFGGVPNSRYHALGFRLVRTATPQGLKAKQESTQPGAGP